MTQKRGLGNHGSSAGFKARVSCRPIFWFRVLMHHRYRVHARAGTGFYLLCIRLCWASRKSRLGILRHGCFARWDERGQDDGGYKYEVHTYTHEMHCRLPGGHAHDGQPDGGKYTNTIHDMPTCSVPRRVCPCQPAYFEVLLASVKPRRDDQTGEMQSFISSAPCLSNRQCRSITTTHARRPAIPAVLILPTHDSVLQRWDGYAVIGLP